MIFGSCGPQQFDEYLLQSSSTPRNRSSYDDTVQENPSIYHTKQQRGHDIAENHEKERRYRRGQSDGLMRPYPRDNEAR